MINIMLVDDHQVVRKGLRTIIDEKLDEVKVVCEAENGEEAIRKIKKYQNIDIVIIDISMPGMSGIELTVNLKETFPELGVLIFSLYEDEEYIVDALNAGAMGYITKNASPDEICNAITSIYDGKMFYASSLSDILARQILRKNRKEAVLDANNITAREREILQLIVKGLSNKEIAEELIVSKRTVDNHRSNLMRKMRAKNTADIVRIAILEELIVN